MGTPLRTVALAILGALTLIGPAARGNDVQALRAEFDALRAHYDARIAILEQRLAVAEQNAATPAAAAPTTMASSGRSVDAAFNPAIGVILQGQAWHYQNPPDDYAVQGFPFGGEAGPIEEGLSIGEAEINISANVDDKFTAWLTAPLVIEDGESAVEIEEAWLEATALPAGLSARFGRFFSGIGYLNNKHAHSWDFADQPLPYQAFLGDQYLDDGVQLRWIAPTDLYLELGAEIFRGSRYPAGGAASSGYGSNSLFVNLGGDVGPDWSWLAGMSYLRTRNRERASGDEDEPLLFSGDTDTTIAQLVWKWAPNGNWKQQNLVIQSEWFWHSEQGDVTLPGLGTLPLDNDPDGWYVQAVYQPIPRWRIGTRVDRLSMGNLGTAFDGSVLAAPNDDPLRYSLMADWSNSEFSRLRLQYTRDDAGADREHQWGLQYTMSIGAHGGHAF